MSVAPVGAPGVVTIDLAALADNYRLLARRAAPALSAAVIKANAYGIGLESAAATLYDAGCRVFFVAHLSEGARARVALPHSDARIYILNGLQADADPAADYAARRLAPAIGSPAELARWAAFAATQEPPPPCALHLDTGMNRLGFDSLDSLTLAMAQFGDRCGADLLMSHFVSAEASDDPLNELQIARFAAARAAFPGLQASLANSSGAFLGARAAGDIIRPGYALYGGNPTPLAENPMRPVVTLEISIQQIRWIEAGDTCGYNAQWTARRRSRLATLLAGYADGLPRAAGAVDNRPGAEILIGGQRCPLVGRMSMDLCIADVTDLPEAAARPGVRAQFFGPDIPLDDFAARSGTIGYHLLTSLGARYARRFA